MGFLTAVGDDASSPPSSSLSTEDAFRFREGAAAVTVCVTDLILSSGRTEFPLETRVKLVMVWEAAASTCLALAV